MSGQKLGRPLKWVVEYPELDDPVWLRERYIDLEMSCTDMAEELGFDVPDHAVLEALKRHGIERRSAFETLRIVRQRRAR